MARPGFRLQRCCSLTLAALACSAPVALACSAPAAPPAPARSSTAIVNGTLDPGDPAVVAMIRRDTVVFGCSGTVIAPRVVLTAGHCAGQLGPGQPTVYFGPDTVAPTSTMGLAYVRAHPDFDRPSALDNDIALFILDAPAPVAPMPLPSGPLDLQVGDTVRLVGFGSTMVDDPSTEMYKREGTATVAEVRGGDELILEPGPSISCSGDSGAPAFFSTGGGEVVAGVISAGDCTGMTRLMRVDAYLANFVEPFLAAAAEGAAATGERCFYPENCAEGVCLSPDDAPAITYCSVDCSGGAACPAPMECETRADGSYCRYPEPSPGAFDTPCTQDYQCASEECRSRAGETEAICTDECVDPDLPCPDGYECVATDDPMVNACFPKDGCACRLAGRRPPPGGAAMLALAALALARGVRRRRRSDP